MDRLIQLIQDEFERILIGPGVTWNKVGMTIALNKALIKAMAIYAKENKISLE